MIYNNAVCVFLMIFVVVVVVVLVLKFILKNIHAIIQILFTEVVLRFPETERAKNGWWKKRKRYEDPC